MIEHGHERGKEDDDRQHAERKDEAEPVIDGRAEHELDAIATVAEDVVDAAREALEGRFADRQIQDQATEHRLERKGTAYRAPVDCLTIQGQRPRKGRQQKNSDEACHDSVLRAR